MPYPVAGGLERAGDVAGELRVIQQVLEDLGADGVGLQVLLGGGEGALDDLLELLAVLRGEVGRQRQGGLGRDRSTAAQQRAEAQQACDRDEAAGQRARAGYQPMACAPRRGSAPPRRTPSLPTTEAQTAPARQS